MRIFNFGNDYAHADSLRKDVGQRIEAVTRHDAIEAVKEAVAQEDAGDQVLEGAEGAVDTEAQEAEEEISSEEPEAEKPEAPKTDRWKNRKKGRK